MNPTSTPQYDPERGGTWWPGRWWRAIDTEGDLWCESSDEDEVCRMARPTDRIQRMWNFTSAEWRDEG